MYMKVDRGNKYDNYNITDTPTELMDIANIIIFMKKLQMVN